MPAPRKRAAAPTKKVNYGARPAPNPKPFSTARAVGEGLDRFADLLNPPRRARPAPKNALDAFANLLEGPRRAPKAAPSAPGRRPPAKSVVAPFPKSAPRRPRNASGR